MSLVFYRKYRPQLFSEAIGQDVIIQTLTNALKHDRISHAYLLSGPFGTGKTTIARIFAKTVNCYARNENNQIPRKSEPCNQCQSCLEITQGQSLDLIEIDAASNRGIDEIRQLKEGIRFPPVKSKYKVFIIDEVHMLTKEAFNALLKTLEEPPEYAIFILATTETEKIPSTILSRVQRFDFKKLTIANIIKKLELIAEKEKIKIEKEALRLIAISAQGAFRDAESMLQRLSSIQTEKISKKEASEILGIIDFKTASELIESLIKNETKESINFLNQISEDGKNLEEFSTILIEYLRKMLVLKIDKKLASLIDQELTPEELEKILHQTEQFSLEKLQKMLNIFLETQEKIKRSSFSLLPLELAVIEIISMK